jgi:acetyl esterase/lipase
MREPQHARLVDDALKLGFEIVDYDVADHCETCSYTDEMREHAARQATNLVSRTLGVDPQAKLFVLTGPRQSYKEPWGPNAPFTTSLANWVWMQTQVEPYAIDQVEIDLPALPFGASSPMPPSGMYMASGPNNGQCMGQYTPRTENGRPALDAVMVHVPPCFVIHGDHDTYTPVAGARRLVEHLRATSTHPVAFAELPGAQHSFDVFHSVRFEHVVDAIEAFAAWVRSRRADDRADVTGARVG